MYWRTFFATNKKLFARCIFVILVVFIAVFCVAQAFFGGKSELDIIYPESNIINLAEGKWTLVAYISGEVFCSGIYSLDRGSRVKDLLLKAQPTPDADLENINPALPLYDGQKIYIPKKGETEDTGSLININTATEKDLMNLSGIGNAIAGKIIEHRNIYGYFTDKEGLKQIRGFGESRFGKIEDLICVGGLK